MVNRMNKATENEMPVREGVYEEDADFEGALYAALHRALYACLRAELGAELGQRLKEEVQEAVREETGAARPAYTKALMEEMLYG